MDVGIEISHGAGVVLVGIHRHWRWYAAEAERCAGTDRNRARARSARGLVRAHLVRESGRFGGGED